MCVCVRVCVGVCTHVHTCLLVCSLERCVGMLEREGGRERRAGVYVSVCVRLCVMICSDFICTFSPIILKKITCYSMMFHTYVFIN